MPTLPEESIVNLVLVATEVVPILNLSESESSTPIVNFFVSLSAKASWGSPVVALLLI